MKRPKNPAEAASPQRGRPALEDATHNRVEFPAHHDATTMAGAKRELKEAARKLRTGQISDGDYDDVRLRTWKARYGEGD